MNKLWGFGDSFSTPFWYQTGVSYKIKYSNFKGYTPKIATEFIAKELQCEFVWKCKSPHDNESIVESIIDNIENIKEEDVIIVGWAPIHRTRFIDTENNVWNFYNLNDNNCKRFPNHIEGKSLEEFSLNRNHFLQVDYIKKLQKLITLAVPTKKIFFWSWGYINSFLECETIFDETEGKVNDKHWSENGHKTFANYFMENYKKNTLKDLVIYEHTIQNS